MPLSLIAFPVVVAGNVLFSSAAISSAPAPVQTDTTLAADTAIAHITTDTGDFAPGRTSLARYNTPQLCLGAVQNTRWVARRDVASQLVDIQFEQAPLNDTLPTSTVDMARRCAASFSVKTTPPRDLSELMRLSLAANQDSIAAQVVTRQLSLASNAAARDSILFAAIETYLDAEPARLATATALVDKVAETGDAGRRWQMGALTHLLNFSRQIWDTTSTVRLANRIIDTVNATPHPRRAQLASFALGAYRALAAQAYLHSPDSLRPIAVRARQTWHDFAAPIDTLDKLTMVWDSARSASVDDYMHELSPVRGTGGADGVPYPALQASHWFPAPPAKGSPRLVVSSEDPGLLHGGCFTGEIELLYDPTSLCLPLYERIRRLSKQYGTRLQIVLVSVTHGNAIRSLPLSPDKETERLKWYLLDYLKLPVTLAVIERPVGSLPAPDGRQWRPRLCERGDPDSDTSATACQYLHPGTVLLNSKGEGVALWGPEAQQDLIIERQVSQWTIEQHR